MNDQDFAHTAFPEDPDYVREGDVLGEDENGWVYGPPESGEKWDTFDRANPRHMAAFEQTKATGRICFLERA